MQTIKIEKQRPVRNGVTRPSIGGKCRAVWDALEGFLAETGEQPTLKGLRHCAEAMGWNQNNAAIEFYRWRKFNA